MWHWNNQRGHNGEPASHFHCGRVGVGELLEGGQGRLGGGGRGGLGSGKVVETPDLDNNCEARKQDTIIAVSLGLQWRRAQSRGWQLRKGGGIPFMYKLKLDNNFLCLEENNCISKRYKCQDGPRRLHPSPVYGTRANTGWRDNLSPLKENQNYWLVWHGAMVEGWMDRLNWFVYLIFCCC